MTATVSDRSLILQALIVQWRATAGRVPAFLPQLSGLSGRQLRTQTKIPATRIGLVIAQMERDGDITDLDGAGRPTGCWRLSDRAAQRFGLIGGSGD